MVSNEMHYSGTDIMLIRRNMAKLNFQLTAGPGVLTKALGININHYGVSLAGDTVWVENGDYINYDQIISTHRIGVDYAGVDALKPWRFFIKENKWVSKL